MRRWIGLLAAGAFAAGCLTSPRPREVDGDMTPVMLDGLELVADSMEVEAVASSHAEAAPRGAVREPGDVADGVESVQADAAGMPPSLLPDMMGTEYIVLPFDSLRIDVFGEADISRDYPVTAEGAIRHPLLGSVRVEGMTLDQVEETLIEKLGRDYLVSPRVTVRLEQSSGRRVTILGEVKRPGTYRVPPDERLSLLRVVALAGGFTDLARITHVRVIRDRDGQELATRVNVSDLLRGRGRDGTADFDLQTGDIVMVPEAVW